MRAHNSTTKRRFHRFGDRRAPGEWSMAVNENARKFQRVQLLEAFDK